MTTDPKPCQLVVRMTAQEGTAVRRAAEAAGMLVPDYVAKVAADAALTPDLHDFSLPPGQAVIVRVHAPMEPQ